MVPSPTGVTLAFSVSGFVVPLMVSSACRPTVSLSMTSAAVTTTLMSGNFSASKKSAECRCASRLPIPVRSDAALMSMWPETVWGAVTWPSPLNSVKRPLTGTMPQNDLLFTATVD